jgi:hypothetical protein
MRASRVLALGLLLASPAASADLCDGPCSITMDFTDGGTISGQGATLVFGTGGSLVLGTGGSLTLGTGGSITPATDPPDMSGGGTVVFGEGGSIVFGTGGSLDTQAGGGIDPGEVGDFSVDGAVDVTVEASASIHLGVLETDGAARITAAGSIEDLDVSTPIHLHTTGSINVVSGHNVTYAAVAGATVELDDNSDDPHFADCSAGCPEGGTGTLGSPNIPVEANTFGAIGAGGAFGLLALLPLLLLGLLRRR